MALLPEKREMAPFCVWEAASQVPEQGWLSSNHQRSSGSWAEFISGHLDWLPFGVCVGGVDFPLELTLAH